MHVGVEIKHFACGGDEPDGPRYDIGAVKVDLKIQGLRGFVWVEDGISG